MPSYDAVNILVVDDMPDKLMAMETVLESLGQNVIQVNSGRDALRHLLEKDRIWTVWTPRP
jgi:CheY-like chemotaxis protein